MKIGVFTALFHDRDFESMVKYLHRIGVEAVELASGGYPGKYHINPATLKKLRAEVGDIIGANFDPSHLIWQGIDPALAIKDLKGMIYHFHAKDTYVDPYNVAVNGVLDTTSLGNIKNRAWYFRTLGYGTPEKNWKDMVSALRLTGFDGILSIEHEDAMMTNEEGLEKAVDFLKRIIPTQAINSDVFWA